MLNDITFMCFYSLCVGESCCVCSNAGALEGGERFQCSVSGTLCCPLFSGLVPFRYSMAALLFAFYIHSVFVLGLTRVLSMLSVWYVACSRDLVRSTVAVLHCSAFVRLRGARRLLASAFRLFWQLYSDS